MKVKKVTVQRFSLSPDRTGRKFLPATKSIPKEIMTLVDRPLIQYAIDEARAAGIKEFIFVTARGKSALEDYFDHSPELESTLRRGGKTDLLEILKDTNMWTARHCLCAAKSRIGSGSCCMVCAASDRQRASSRCCCPMT